MYALRTAEICFLFLTLIFGFKRTAQEVRAVYCEMQLQELNSNCEIVKEMQQQQLGAMIPPPNFGMVEWGIYRSGYPSQENLPFLKKLGLRSVVYVCMEPCRNQEFLELNGIRLFHLGMEGKKDLLVSMPEGVMREVLNVLLDVRNYPLLIHCNAGKHRSGRVVGCLRKIQKWPLASIFEEYEEYAGDKCRSRDQEFIQAFNGSSLEQRAQEWMAFMCCWNFAVRMALLEAITLIHELDTRGAKVQSQCLEEGSKTEKGQPQKVGSN